MKNLSQEERLLRQALLRAAEADDAQRLAGAPEPPPLSPAYQKWERKFLKNPAHLAKKACRPRWQKALRTAACFLLLLGLLGGTVLIASPSARAAVADYMGYEVVGFDFPSQDLTIQLSGVGSGFYTSELFTCVEENGNALRYSFQNNGTDACYVSLSRCQWIGGQKRVTDLILVEPGETGGGTYENSGNGTYCVRIQSEMGGSISGSLKVLQVITD